MGSKKIIYEPSAGENIKYSAKKAVALAKNAGSAKVSFKFNGIALIVNGKSKPEEIVDTYNKKIDKQQQAYENSPRGRAAAKRRAAEVKAKQARLHKCVHTLDTAIKGGLKTLIPWVRNYADDADDIDIEHKGERVWEKLADAGYSSNEYTGENFVKGNKKVMGRYIVGGVLACLEAGMPPHPSIVDSSDEYMAMPDKPSSRAQSKFKLK